MASYLEQAEPRRILDLYPIGEAFLRGPARLPREQLRSLQERRFRAVVARAWQVPFYRRLWGGAGIEPGDVRSLDDLGALPTFSKADLMRSVEEHPPFGDYHGVDLGSPDRRESVVLHTTSGTTGEPQPLLFGAWDREVQNALLARAYLLQGLRADDVVHSVYGFGTVNGGHFVREAIIHFTRALLVPAGTGLETRSTQQIALMRRFGATVVVGFADYVRKLASVAHEQGLEPGRDLRVRMISGHLGQESRESLSRLWGGAEVYDWYGVGDTGSIAAEGPDRDGLYVWEDAHLVEILDPETNAPRADGESGNLCVTALFKHTVYPIVRFDTNDVSRFITTTSRLDIGFRRIAGFLGRSDNMVKLRGINVYPTAISAFLAEHPAATGEYVCRVTRDGDRDEMTVVVEVQGVDTRDAGVRAALACLLRERIGVEVLVDLAAPGGTAALTQIEQRQKPIRLLDER
jgi:phenylacetate-CoA ligase